MEEKECRCLSSSWHTVTVGIGVLNLSFVFLCNGSHNNENIAENITCGGGGESIYYSFWFWYPMKLPFRLQSLMSKQCSWGIQRDISMGLELKANWAWGCGYWSPHPKSRRASDQRLYDFGPAWGVYYLWIKIMMFFSLSPFQVVRSWKSWATEGQSTTWWAKFIVICSPHLIPVSILQFKENNSFWQCVWIEVRFSFKDNNSSDEASVKQPGFRMAQFCIYVSSLEAKETGGENTNNPWLEGYPIITVAASTGLANDLKTQVQTSLLVLE